MRKYLSENELRDAELIWLLDLTLGGTHYFFSTESLSIPSDYGDIFFDGTLTDVSVEGELEFATPDFNMPSAQVSLTFKTDLARLIAQGVDLGSASAELSIFRRESGDDYDDRIVILQGPVDVPSYGALGEPVSFTIEADFIRNQNQMPSPNAVIDESVNWPNSVENSQGAVYPMIFGAPGSQGFAGSPVYIVNDPGSGNRTGLVAGHACTATQVTLIGIKSSDSSFLNKGTRTITGDVDTSGQPYSYINVPSSDYEDSNTYWVRWDKGEGGLINPYTTSVTASGSKTVEPISGAGDILRYLLTRSGSRVDDARCFAASHALNAIQLDFYLAEVVDIMEFVKSEIMPLLPCSLRSSGEGLYPVVWRYDATVEDAKANLTANIDIFRSSMVEYQTGTVYNDITINYRHNSRFNKLMKKLTVTGDITKVPTGFISQNSYTLASANRYGLKSLSIDTELISSRASAGRVINWMSRAYSGQHRTIKYKGRKKLAYIEIGDVVVINDPDLSLENQIVLVQAVEWGESDLTFTFLLIPDIPRDTIPVG